MSLILSLRTAVRRAAGRAGVLPAVFAAYRWTTEWTPGHWVADRRFRRAARAGGLPIPPARLLYSVATTPRATHFLDSGIAAARSLEAALERAGRPFATLDAVLDFGCGCGRVLRHWPRNGPALFGCDYNPAGIDWLHAHMPWVTAHVNGASPPLPYQDGTFDYIYALSVFTHLPLAAQDAWMAELHRILRPGGLLAFSTLGEKYLGRLTPREREHFERGEPVIRNAELAGSNLCAAYHPRQDVVGRLARGFRQVEFVAEGALGNVYQDLYLFERLAT